MTAAAAVALLVHRGTAPLATPVRDLALLATVAGGAHCLELGTRDLDAAAATIESLLELPVGPDLPFIEASGEITAAWIAGEVVVHAADQIHHLNPMAAAVYLLADEGLDATAIADELGTDVPLVRSALAELDRAAVRPGGIRQPGVAWT